MEGHGRPGNEATARRAPPRAVRGRSWKIVGDHVRPWAARLFESLVDNYGRSWESMEDHVRSWARLLEPLVEEFRVRVELGVVGWRFEAASCEKAFDGTRRQKKAGEGANSLTRGASRCEKTGDGGRWQEMAGDGGRRRETAGEVAPARRRVAARPRPPPPRGPSWSAWRRSPRPSSARRERLPWQSPCRQTWPSRPWAARTSLGSA